MRDMIIAALQNCGLFTITENQDKADASLKGSSDDKIYTEEHHTTDSLGVHANGGSGSSSTARPGTGSSSRGYGGAGITESETSNVQERRHEAVASVRLVDQDGDVIWSTTQESGGGKFKGALADIADRIAKKLVEDTKQAPRSSVRSTLSCKHRAHQRSFPGLAVPGGGRFDSVAERLPGMGVPQLRPRNELQPGGNGSGRIRLSTTSS